MRNSVSSLLTSPPCSGVFQSLELMSVMKTETALLEVCDMIIHSSDL